MTRHPPQQGLSLVELMVGIAIGLLVTAGLVKAFAGHVSHTQRMLQDARVEQDLRSAVEVIVRDVRRAGHWSQAARPPGTAASNPFEPIDLPTVDEIRYAYAQNGNAEVDSNEHHGFRLQGQVLKGLDGGSGWQPLTDPAVVRVTELSIDLHARAEPLGHFCMPACTADNPACPRVEVREVVVHMKARSASDPAVQREAHERVLVRNDAVSPERCP
jgi:type IV pilus assembly protein PilW